MQFEQNQSKMVTGARGKTKCRRHKQMGQLLTLLESMFINKSLQCHESKDAFRHLSTGDKHVILFGGIDMSYVPW